MVRRVYVSILLFGFISSRYASLANPGDTSLPSRWSTEEYVDQFQTTPSAKVMVDNFVFIDNSIIKLGVDTSRGGAIGYLSLSNQNSSYTNVHDFGRLVQGSFYSGPVPYDPSQCNDPSWTNWPWNPIGGGDAFGHSAVILSLNKTSDSSIVVTSIPYQWACNDVPCECTFTQEITLVGNAAEIRLTLNNSRTDIPLGALYPATQELPAIYIIGSFCNLYTYNGSSPFTSQLPSQLPTTWPWSTFSPTEHWMAYSNGTDIHSSISVGVWTPFFNRAGSGRYFSNTTETCVGGPYDDPVGYIAPWITEILDSRIVYSYNFSLIVDTVANIQQYATLKHLQNLDESLAPNYIYGISNISNGIPTRAHCTFGGKLVDGGWPIPNDGIVFDLGTNNYDRADVVLGPFSSWDATDVPVLYFNVSYSVSTVFAVNFQIYGSDDFCPTCSIDVPVNALSGFQIIPVHLSSIPLYQGRIERISYAPTVSAVSSQRGSSTGSSALVQLRSITTTDPSTQ